MKAIFPPVGKKAAEGLFLKFILVVGLLIVNVGAIPPLQIEDPRFLDQDFEVLAKRPPNAASNLLASPEYRLPTIVYPINYNLKIKPILFDLPGTPYAKFTAPGEVTITIQTSQPTSTLILHQKDLTIDLQQIQIKKASDGTVIPINYATVDLVTDFYKMDLALQLEPSNNYTVFIPYTAKVNLDALDGIYMSYYQDPASGETKYLSTTQFQPGDARKAFPCFDEPQFKATFDITVGRYKNYTSLSNMNQISSAADTDPDFADWSWDSYATTVKMSTYLIAFIVSDFTYSEGPGDFGGKPIRTYGAKHLIDLKGGDWASIAAENMIKYFQNFVQIPYALPKLDSVAIPQFSAGAMENWGLNTYRTAYIIHIPGLNTEAERKKITQVLGHEISHQWFGNLVTCQWWSNTWLNEGFARFLQYRGMNSADPSLNTSIAIISDATQLAMIFDQGKNTHPVLNNAQSLSEVSEIFDRISYEKGASLLRMLEGFLTTAVFDNSLRHYIAGKTFQTAVQDDLFDSFQQFGKDKIPKDTTVHEIMRSWTMQSGFPLVRVSVAGKNKIYLSQEKYFLNTLEAPTSSQSDAGKSTGLWYVPVKIVSAGNPDFENKTPNVWIPDNVVTLSYSQAIDTTKWIIVNPDLSGYYRVLYDPELLQLIKNQLDADHNKISPGTRSQILEDYFNFAMSGHVTIETTLDLTTYLHKETELVVWAPVLTNLRAMLNRFDTDSNKITIFKNYIWSKLEGALNTLKWQQATDEKGAQVILRSQLLDFACVLNSSECIKRIGLTFPSAKVIPADLRPIVYCASVATGDLALWNTTLGLYLVEPNEIIKDQLLKSLTCTGLPAAFNQYIKFAVDETHGFKLVDTLKTIAKNSVGREVAFKFIQDNYGPLASIDAAKFADVLGTLSGYFGQQNQLNELKAFIAKNEATLQPVMNSINNSIAIIEGNILWWTGGDGLYISSWMTSSTTTSNSVL